MLLQHNQTVLQRNIDNNNFLQKKLFFGDKELVETKEALATTQKKFDAMKNNFEEQKQKELQANRLQLEETKAALDAKQKDLDAMKNNFEEQKQKELQANRLQLEETKAALDTKQKDLDAMKNNLEQKQLELQADRLELDKTKAALDTKQKKLKIQRKLAKPKPTIENFKKVDLIQYHTLVSHAEKVELLLRMDEMTVYYVNEKQFFFKFKFKLATSGPAQLFVDFTTDLSRYKDGSQTTFINDHFVIENVDKGYVKGCSIKIKLEGWKGGRNSTAHLVNANNIDDEHKEEVKIKFGWNDIDFVNYLSKDEELIITIKKRE